MSDRHLLPIACLLLAACAGANPGAPGPATVHVVRSEIILVPQGIFAPRLLYPEGRVDFDIVERLMDQAMQRVTGKDPDPAWQQFVSPTDTVGVMIEANRYPVQAATVEVIIDRLVSAGVAPGKIIVFGGDERDLFAAGFNISRDPSGVRVLGAESEGFRGGISRIVTDYCDVIINVGALRTDPDLGMAGCLANTLACVPTVRRVALLQAPAELPEVAAHPALRRKIRLNILEAYLPLLETVGQARTTWQYKGLLIGTDMVAVDTVGLKILEGCRRSYKQADWPLPASPGYLQTAQEAYHVGQADDKRITVNLSGYAEGSYLQ